MGRSYENSCPSQCVAAAARVPLSTPNTTMAAMPATPSQRELSTLYRSSMLAELLPALARVPLQ
jgi:hypothetical protein